jgi:hypothetical protein
MENEFTPEQQKQFNEAYSYQDKAEITEDEMNTARAMFDTPEKFRILRKFLQILTQDERGVTYTGIQSLVQASESDLKTYALESAVQHLAYEKVRQALLNFYLKLHDAKLRDLKKVATAENKKQFEEDKRTEEYLKEKEEAKKRVGDNL